MSDEQPSQRQPSQPPEAAPDQAAIEREVLAGVLAATGPLTNKECTPLDAEMWGSQMLGMVGLTMSDPTAVERVFGDVLVPMIEQEPSVEGLAVLQALAAVGSRDLRTTATGAAERLGARGIGGQPWAAQVGKPVVEGAWAYGDAFGAQESVLISFSYDRKPHAVCVLIDHNLGGGIKEAFVVTDLSATLARIRNMQEALPDLVLEQIEHAEARTRLEQAIRAGECPAEPEQFEDVASTRALLRTRVRLLAEAG